MMNTQLLSTYLWIKAWLTPPTREERGSVSVEQAVITGAIALLATIVGAALTAFAQGKLAALGG